MINTIWSKVGSTILTAGIIAAVSFSYQTMTQIALVQSDVTHVRDTLQGFEARLERLEATTMTSKDAEQLKTWTELMIKTIEIQIQSTERDIDKLMDKYEKD